MIGALAIVLASEFDGVVISAVPVVDFVGTYVGFCCFNGVRFLFMDGTVASSTTCEVNEKKSCFPNSCMYACSAPVLEEYWCPTGITIRLPMGLKELSHWDNYPIAYKPMGYGCLTGTAIWLWLKNNITTIRLLVLVREHSLEHSDIDIKA
jgi:hypothetical protein